MNNLDTLQRVLEESVKRNGADKPLTIGHLLNIIKMANDLELKENVIAEELEAWNHKEALEFAIGSHGQG